MKILCIIESLGSGGAERQLVGLARQLKNNEQDVSVLTYEHKDFYISTLKSSDISYEEVAVGKSFFTRFFCIWRCIHKHKPDWIISFSRASSIIVCILKPFIHHSKILVSERNTTQELTKIERLKFFLYRFADYIIPNSYSQSRFIKKHYPKLVDKCHVITNFVDTVNFRPNDGVDYILNNILVVARVSKQKNVISFISAVKAIATLYPDVIVDWYGDQSDIAYFDTCKYLIREHNIEKNFVFHRPEKNISDIYKKYAVFCLPSYYEGYPNVICEAMSSGNIVLCSDVSDNATIVEDGVNGFLFNPNHVGSIVGAFTKLYELNETEIATMRKRNREKMVANNSIDSFTNNYLSLIQSVK